jgi:hypothetical protein
MRVPEPMKVERQDERESSRVDGEPHDAEACSSMSSFLDTEYASRSGLCTGISYQRIVNRNRSVILESVLNYFSICL